MNDNRDRTQVLCLVEIYLLSFLLVSFNSIGVKWLNWQDGDDDDDDDFEMIRHYMQAGSQGIIDTVAGIPGNNT